MAIIRAPHKRDYTMIANEAIRDTRLSLRDLGLLLVMLRLPDGWHFSITGLATMCRDGKDSIRQGMCALEECGYLERTHVMDERHLLRVEYILHEKPDLPASDFPTAGIPTAGAPTQSRMDTDSIDPEKNNNNTLQSRIDLKQDPIGETMDFLEAPCAEQDRSEPGLDRPAETAMQSQAAALSDPPAFVPFSMQPERMRCRIADQSPRSPGQSKARFDARSKSRSAGRRHAASAPEPIRPAAIYPPPSPKESIEIREAEGLLSDWDEEARRWVGGLGKRGRG